MISASCFPPARTSRSAANSSPSTKRTDCEIMRNMSGVGGFERQDLTWPSQRECSISWATLSCAVICARSKNAWRWSLTTVLRRVAPCLRTALRDLIFTKKSLGSWTAKIWFSRRLGDFFEFLGALTSVPCFPLWLVSVSCPWRCLFIFFADLLPFQAAMPQRTHKCTQFSCCNFVKIIALISIKIFERVNGKKLVKAQGCAKHAEQVHLWFFQGLTLVRKNKAFLRKDKTCHIRRRWNKECPPAAVWPGTWPQLEVLVRQHEEEYGHTWSLDPYLFGN